MVFLLPLIVNVFIASLSSVSYLSVISDCMFNVIVSYVSLVSALYNVSESLTL